MTTLASSKQEEQGVWVLIPAAGVGSRMNSAIPKQYLKIDGKTVLEHTVSRFDSLPHLAGILIVVSEADPYWESLESYFLELSQSKGIPFLSTIGGNERSETVLKGLGYLLESEKADPSQWVMVHDAARPCVRKKDLLNLLAAREGLKYSGAILASPVRDTLKLSDQKNAILETQSREALWQAQTPQFFQLGVLYAALNLAIKANVVITDEASAMEFCRKKVQLVEGSSDNIKLTTSTDLAMIEFLLKNSEG
jgi:2-C-methyl-D-erythritol 4-phosphate cytidylyltransferase